MFFSRRLAAVSVLSTLSTLTFAATLPLSLASAAALPLTSSSPAPIPVSSIASTPSNTTRPTRDVRLCNRHAEYCDRKYSDITFVGTHNSAFVGNLIDPRMNQEVPVGDQLRDGIRFLQAQTHRKWFWEKDLQMCHTSCWLEESGSLHDYLETVYDFLDYFPDEVITLLLVNGGNVKMDLFDKAFKATGLRKYAYIPAHSPDKLEMGDWPTLGEMIDKDKRLVVFIDSNTDEERYPYLLDEWKYFFETPYGVLNPDDLLECRVDRPHGVSPDGRMMLVNHFRDKRIIGKIIIPDTGSDGPTNAATGEYSLGHQVDACVGVHGRKPNVILVDHYNRGHDPISKFEKWVNKLAE